MPISITCRCGYTITAPERLAGRTLRCPKCLGEFTVPQASMAPPPPIVPMPAPTPMAAFASAPTDALDLEAAAPEPMLEPEVTMPLMEAPAMEEDAFAMEQVDAAPGQDAPEFGSSDLAVDSQETVASAAEEDALGFERGLPLEGDVPVMNEEELGMFLMDDEPPPEPKKKKKK